MAYQSVFQYFQWVTKFHIDGAVYGGNLDLTNDGRISQLNELFSLKGKRILELGPLEGAHSLMMSRLGAREVVAIEGRAENFIKCCVIKNLFRLHNVHFILADVNDVTAERLGSFDIAVAIGILYHLQNPARVLQNLSAMTNRLFIWTHYADDAFPAGPIQTLNYAGNSYMGKTYIEGGPRDPSSGLEATSFWAFEKDLYAMIRNAGFKEIIVLNKGSMYQTEEKHCTIFASKKASPPPV